MSFAENLKSFRLSKEVTQQELADYLMVTRPTIAGYETKGKEPDYRTLSLIAEFFDVSIDYLVRGSSAISFSQSSDSNDTTVTIHICSKRAHQLVETVQVADTLNARDFARLRDYLFLLQNQTDYTKKRRLPS